MLIDRLVRHCEIVACWVLDYKFTVHPDSDITLNLQMQRYRVAVQNANPGATVRAAFLTGQGELVSLE